ncbi:MAG: glutamate-1-semialdehyde 2,1-aminomutase [Candidatus Latescibacteria bacterium]|nr:glutamate-1-semialdehyde 2,1-aminomutase [Candidatus Latescibacterota bacterium]
MAKVEVGEEKLEETTEEQESGSSVTRKEVPVGVESQSLFEEAQRYIPGGVNSPVRAFGSVGGEPIFIERGAGSKVYDVDGREYIDYVCSWGPLILGHSHPEVVDALKAACERGTSFGAPTEIEVDLARLIVESVPSIEMVRMVNSGTEATMSAIRLARGYTGREVVVKFEGCYHGHGDSFLIKAGSGVATLGIPGSPGVPSGTAKATIAVPFNDLDAVKQAMSHHRGQIAAVIIEPIAGNIGTVPPREGFLEGLREVTANEGIILIFDEVITGFRVASGGAQDRYGVIPDLTCLGKIIGGGLPVGAYGGKREIMEYVAPLGPVYQAGTLSGNPLAMTAGYVTLSILRRPGTYERLEHLSALLASGMVESVRSLSAKATFHRVGSMLCMFLTDRTVWNYDDARTFNPTLFTRYFRGMLDRGVSIAPSQFETSFVSLAHTEQDIERTIAAHEEALKAALS